MTNNGTGELTKALAAVSKAVGSLQPDKRNQQQKYDYISADKILEVVGKELPKHGLAIIPSVVDDNYETVEYKQGSIRIDGRVRFIMHVCHESGEQINTPWTGYGSDYVVPDKAIYKAITSGHKYFLMKLFNIGVGNEDSEHDSYPKANGGNPLSDTRQETSPQKQAQRKRPAVPEQETSQATIVDCRAWLEEKFANGKTNLGMVLDAAAMTSHYNSWKHAHNALTGENGYEFPDKFKVNRSQTITSDGALKVYDWLMERKVD